MKKLSTLPKALAIGALSVFMFIASSNSQVAMGASLSTELASESLADDQIWGDVQDFFRGIVDGFNSKPPVNSLNRSIEQSYSSNDFSSFDK
ncbi:hypothetical protein [Hymenobacter metallicola]|uniref:Uncharacterized protein n=1 Tax=Hymenobacter metallicola TaxID=2563114 RepID=A0A4Z0QE15_9BACT|nr:hypothetical protein [Hymenobacter metallicola]TGE27423.1 hypothetical protein E5K02_13670 [Hymenobacter metallicola]